MRKLLLGNAAVARGAYEAGVRVVASYPGTPSTEITEEIVKFEEIYAEWAPNEVDTGNGDAVVTGVGDINYGESQTDGEEENP